MRKLLLTIAASTLMATGALAADPVMTIEPAYIESSSGFDWDGFYMGIGILGASFTPAASLGQIDFIAGANFTNGDMLFGLEGWLGFARDNLAIDEWGGGIEARAGYLITPEALLYVSGGGQFYNGGSQYGTIGAGMEFAVTDNVSLDLEYKYWGWSNTAFTGHSIGASALWHF